MIHLPKCSRGQTIVLFAFALVAIVGALALTTDVTAAYWNWEQLQKAADAGALAGASQYIPHIPSPPAAGKGCSGPTVNLVACTYAVQNNTVATEVTVQSPSPTIPASVPAGAQTVMVKIQRNTIPVYFARLVGRTTPYAATATAIAVGPTTTNSVHNGLFPAGMPYDPKNMALTYGTEYTLTGDYTSGDWGWLDIPNGYQGSTSPSGAPSGGGAAQLATNITSGCTCDVSVGNYVSSEPGDDWGQVKSAVNSLATGAKLPSTLTGNEPQLVTVPIVDWSTSGTGSTPVKIMGFAQMWLVGIKKQGNNETLDVQFVQYVSNYASSGGSTTSYGSSKKPYLVQ